MYCRYTDIHIGMPCLEEEYRQEEITPQQCRLRDITYAGEWCGCMSRPPSSVCGCVTHRRMMMMRSG